MWSIHKDDIARITGVNNPQDYLNNPEAQEKYQKHLANNYESNVSSLRKKHNISKNVPDETLMMLQHFLGLGDANVYLDTLMRTKSYEAAQQAVDDSIRNRTGKTPPRNALIVDYIEKFQNQLNLLPKKEVKPETKVQSQPQVMAPKKQPVINTNPTFEVLPGTKVQTEPQIFKQPTVNPNPTFTASPVRTPVVTETPSKPINKEEVSKAIESKFKIKPSNEQLDILMDNSLSPYEKGRKLGIIPEGKSFSGPQNISNPNRLQEAWETLINEGIGALFDQTISAATSPNEGLEQKIKPIPEPNINDEKSTVVSGTKTKPKVEEQEPAKVVLGSRVENYGGNPDRYIEPFKVNTNSAKFGVRSRGETQDINTEGVVFTTFKPWTYASSPEYVNEFNYYLVVDKTSGNLKIATNPKQNKDSMLNKQEVKANPEMVTTGTYGRLAKSLNLNGKYNDGISSKTLGYVNQDGKQASLPTFGIGKDGSELGGYKGGKLILSKPDGSDPIIVYGSAQIVINEFEKYKKKHNLENVLVLDADGKSYAQSYQTKSKVIKGSDLRSKNWDNANTASAGSGNILYLK